MRKRPVSLCLLLLSLTLPVERLQAEDLPTILQRMNQEAPKLHSLSADMQLVTFTAVISDTITENGTLKMQKDKQGAVRAILDFSATKDSAREIGLFGGKIRMYFPNAKYYQDYEFGKNGGLINQFLLLGFGASGDELSKNYTITAGGTEKIGSVTTTKLMLVPKDPKVKEKLSRAEIWIPEGQTNPIQQQFYVDPSGNYRKVSYTRIEINPSFKGRLDIQIPSHTQKRN